MKKLQGLMANLATTLAKSRLWRVGPVLEAMDEALFGTPRTARDAPHIFDGIDLKRFMAMVVVALMPLALAGVYFYGWRVVAVIVVSYVAGGATEIIFSAVRRRPLHEGFLVTGLIFPLLLPPTVPLWMVAVGVSFGTFFGKEVFGGTGKNIFNPALVGRVFLSLSFPGQFASRWQLPTFGGAGGLTQWAPDAVTSATPLIAFKSTGAVAEPVSLLFGSTPGSIGETFRIAIILGGLLLVVTRIADWRVPLAYIVSAALFALVGNAVAPARFAPPLFQVLSGGLLFGAFFMATDPVTSPLTRGGRWIFGILLGLLTILIRGLSGFVEGVTYAILLMNALSPLIDDMMLKRRFRRLPATRAEGRGA
jgi:RnfABCDGE-type electron transport complex D subunit